VDFGLLNASVAVQGGTKGMGLAAYTAAKAMVTSVTKNLSQSLAPEAILVNTVSPGPFVTTEISHILESEGVDPTDLHASMQYLAQRYGHPSQLQRMGTPSEIGPVIAFMASRRNSYMTGANVNVDGGHRLLLTEWRGVTTAGSASSIT
jgi:3-oxoacyl-[acyl-carrier protein] reductase